MKNATGEFMARIDHDDIWYKDKLKIQVDFLVSNLDFDIIGSQAMYSIKTISEKRDRLTKLPCSYMEIRQRFTYGNPFIHSAILLRASVIKDVGGYDERFKFAQDYELWSRILQKSKGANLSVALCRLGIDNGSISSKNAKSQRAFALYAKILASKRLGFSLGFLRHFVKDAVFILSPKILIHRLRNANRFS